MGDINTFLDEKRALVDDSLKTHLPSENSYPTTIHKSMHYSVFAGGKRLRPILTLTVGDFFSGSQKLILPFAAAIEMIHTYSLIHDDLPALDNDDMRRGKPTNHVVFGEDMAILTGDALLNRSFEVMAETSVKADSEEERSRCLLAIKEIANAAGTSGMIGGQVIDLEMEHSQKASLDTVSYIHQHKTGALFTASARVGAVLSGAGNSHCGNITEYANKLGFAFQVVDDILDVQGDQEEMGKTTGKDAVQGKATYPGFTGVENAKSYASKLHEEALAALSGYSNDSAYYLREIANKLLKRVS